VVGCSQHQNFLSETTSTIKAFRWSKQIGNRDPQNLLTASSLGSLVGSFRFASWLIFHSPLLLSIRNHQHKTDLLFRKSATRTRSNHHHIIITVSVEAYLTQEFDILFIDARSIVKEVKVSLGINGYPSEEERLQV
jgi:hypothetical protein